MKDIIAIIPVSSFEESKTRLSSILNDKERIELLKFMLKDIVNIIQDYVEEIYLVSKDDSVKKYSKQLNTYFIKEKKHENNFLNNALKDAIKYVKEKYPNNDILILPSDIPLIKQEHVISLKQMNNDLIISPSRGGGTNLLCFNSSFDFKCNFGDMSYFKHLTTAHNLGMSINLIESFYISMDVNTPEDLGELLLHGSGTLSYKYLKDKNFKVYSNHGKERLNVTRY